MGIECTLQHAPWPLFYSINFCHRISSRGPTPSLFDTHRLDPSCDHCHDFGGNLDSFFTRK